MTDYRLAPDRSETRTMQARAIMLFLHGGNEASVKARLMQEFPRILPKVNMDDCQTEARRLKAYGWKCTSGCELCREREGR